MWHWLTCLPITCGLYPTCPPAWNQTQTGWGTICTGTHLPLQRQGKRLPKRPPPPKTRRLMNAKPRNCSLRHKIHEYGLQAWKQLLDTEYPSAKRADINHGARMKIRKILCLLKHLQQWQSNGPRTAVQVIETEFLRQRSKLDNNSETDRPTVGLLLSHGLWLFFSLSHLTVWLRLVLQSTLPCPVLWHTYMVSCWPW